MKQKKETDYMIERKLDAAFSKHYEGVFAQGSGYLQIRGSFEEGLACAAQDETYMRMPANVTIEKPRHPRSKCGTYVPGITGIHPLLKEELVNLPNPLCLEVTADQERLDMDQSLIKEYERRLDMKTGVLERTFLWEIEKGEKILNCRYLRYVSKTVRNLIVQKASFQAEKGDLALRVISDIDENVKTNGYQHFVRMNKKTVAGGHFLEGETDNGDCIRMMTFAKRNGVCFGDETSEQSMFLGEGESAEILKMTIVSTSRDPEGFLSEEEMKSRLEEFAKKETKIREEHIQAWADLWKCSEIQIEGDDEAQRAVNFAIYHLLRCANDRDSRIAICAKGFAGEAYFGHFFWDTEVYLLPFFLYTQPRTARNLVEFRIKTLEGAKKNARAYGYAGARYPWESSVSGEEQCPNWQYADHEVHVTADVTLGIWHYYKNTQDLELLREAAPVFIETSRYWMERISRNPDGSVHINGVMGPDEYVCFCDDNAYTNYLAALSLKNTVRVLKKLEEEEPGIGSRLGVDEEYCRLLEDTAEHMVIHRDSEGRMLQCKHFEELEEPEFEQLWTDRSKPFGQFVSQERNYRTKSLKQADVLMLFYLFGQDMDQESLEDNYRYYLPYTTHDSSLSSIIHAILCCRRGKADEAYQFFQSAAGIDIDEEGKGAAEGIHIANCGGIWQAIVFGFAGLCWAYESETPRFSPVLPEHWKKISFPLFYRGKNMQVTITEKGVWLDGKRYQ